MHFIGEPSQTGCPKAPLAGVLVQLLQPVSQGFQTFLLLFLGPSEEQNHKDNN